MDWDKVFAGARKMGWYNCTCEIVSKDQTPKDLNALVKDLMDGIKTNLVQKNIEAVHLKAICKTDDDFVKAALTSTKNDVFISDYTEKLSEKAQLTVNIRAVAPPEILSEIINNTLTQTLSKCVFTSPQGKYQSFASTDEPPVPAAVEVG